MFERIAKNYIYKLTVIIFIFTVLLFSKQKCFADPILKDGILPSFELIDRDSGLSNLSVSSIIQDKYGFLWFGTQGGLNRYDGRQMKVFRNNPFEDDGLIHNLIQTMYYDEKNHEMWIGTYQGLSRLLIDKNTFINYSVEKDGLSNSVIIAITKDKNENIWLGTMDGLNRLNPATGEIKKYQVPGNVVRDLMIDTNGRLLIGSYEGLLYYDFQEDDIKKIELELPSPYVMLVREYKQGVLTLGLWNGGISEVDLKTGEVNTKSFSDNRVYSYTQTDDGTQWIGTWGGGLFAITSDGKRYHFDGTGKEQSLMHPVVYSMYQDNSGILWIGTNGGGLCKVNPRKANYVKFSHDSDNLDSLSQGKINKIFKDTKGNIWIAIYNEGLNRYDPLQDKIIKYKHDSKIEKSLPDNQVLDIIEIENNKLLLGTGVGLVFYDMETHEFSSYDILPNDTMVYSLEKTEDNILWIGTYRNGVYRYDINNGELKQFKYIDSSNYTLSDNLVYDILIDSKKRVWVGTNNGLNVLMPKENEFKIYHRVSGDYTKLASNTIRTLFEDSKGKIWIGMVGGGIALYEEEKDNFKSFTEENGLSGNTAMGILEAKDGRIWVSTHNGISIIKPESQHISVLTPDDGIGGWEFNTGYLCDDGVLLFGGIHGLTVIPTDYRDMSIEPPKIYITSIDLFQTSIDENRQFFNDSILEFGANDSFLGFKFVALDFDSPEKTKFSYKLEGFDKEWIYSGTRDYASYSNLPHGSYQLKVMAETSKGIQSEPASVYFTIATPWYRTSFAYMFYGLCILLLIFGAFKIREGHVLSRKNSELSRINEKLELANSELENLSIKDSLTGLFNRRYFDIVFEEQLSLAKRSKTYLSLIMFDVDNFKVINDSYGHIAGDYYLADISKAILDVLPRSTDFIARYGGDEFCVVLYDTDSVGALIVAKRIKKAAESISIRSEFSSKEVKATLSMGLVSIIPIQETTIKDMIQYADEALYTAKVEGRNRICISKSN